MSRKTLTFHPAGLFSLDAWSIDFEVFLRDEEPYRVTIDYDFHTGFDIEVTAEFNLGDDINIDWFLKQVGFDSVRLFCEALTENAFVLNRDPFQVTVGECDELCDHEYVAYCPNCGIDSEEVSA